MMSWIHTTNNREQMCIHNFGGDTCWTTEDLGG
jgi:hypothetical protein